jgi:hypothetical protein
MGRKIIQLETARTSTKLWLVWFDGQYQAVNVTGKSRLEAIACLPTPAPNFVWQVARNQQEAIQLVKDTQSEDLLSSPV